MLLQYVKAVDMGIQGRQLISQASEVQVVSRDISHIGLYAPELILKGLDPKLQPLQVCEGLLPLHYLSHVQVVEDQKPGKRDDENHENRHDQAAGGYRLFQRGSSFGFANAFIALSAGQYFHNDFFVFAFLSGHKHQNLSYLIVSFRQYRFNLFEHVINWFDGLNRLNRLRIF
jgi:hypothetical protein